MAPIGDVNNKSRYGETKATAIQAVQEIKPEDVPNLVKELRDSFNTEKTYSVAWRKSQLRAFKRMLVEEEATICKGLFDDLHKSAFESYATEIGVLHHEIEEALEHLDEWLKPIKTKNSALNIPCWSTTQRDPLGVCLVLGAWNYPVNLSLAPMIGAIMGGNCVIMKPGSYAMSTSNVLAKIIPKYLDPECIRVVEGNRHVTSALLKEKFDHIFFTGSAFVGKVVARAAAEHLTPVVLELGGKSPCIVDKSVNVDHAAKRIVWAKFLNSGQTCVACDFMMVHEDVAEKLFAALKKYIREFYSEDAQKTEFYGRLINDSAFKRLDKLVQDEAARAITGGKPGDPSERYLQPTILDFGTDMDAFRNSEVMADELFGPILPTFRYRNLEDCIQFVKNLPTGKPLALYAYGSDPKFIEQIKNRTTSGGLVINDSIMHLVNGALPFGGIGESGMGGGYHGYNSFKQFTHEKAVLEKSQALDELPLFKPLLDMRFPPYTPLKKTVVRAFGAHWIEKAVNLPVPAARLIFKILLAYLAMRLLGFRISRD